MRIPGWMPESIHIPSLPVKRDALLLPTFFVLNVFTFSAWIQLSEVAARPWLLLVWLYGLAVLVPLIWRDRAPVAVFITQVLAVAPWPILHYYTPVVGIPVALYAVSVQRSRTTSSLALVASFLPNELAASVAFMNPSTSSSAGIYSFIGNTILLCLITVAAWGAGCLTQASRLHVQQLERERETAREAVAEERRRIARELHDIVSHAVTVIVLQAAGASRVAETDLARVIESLGHIQAMGERAMAELGRLLGVLRASDAASPAVGLGELGPQPGLAELPMLLGSLQAIGMPVNVDVVGTTSDLDPSVDLAAYRIVQEGLTNVLKHAGKDASPRLRLSWEAEVLLIQIDNDTNPARADPGQQLSTGRGLVGLHERARAAGGHLHAGLVQHGGGYRLAVTLPLTDTVLRHATARRALYPSRNG
jgi:signal transduction histidine kinase